MDVLHSVRDSSKGGNRDTKNPQKYLSLMKSQPDWFNTQVVAQEVSEFQEMGTEVSHNKKPIINFARNTPKPIACVKPLQKVKTFIENVISPCLESNKKVSNEQNYKVSDINEGKIEMKTIDKRSHDNEKKDYKTIFKYHLSTSIIDKEAALDAVKSVNLYHLANEAVFRGKTSVLKSMLPESEKKTLCGQCGKVFAHADSLSRHKIVHSGDKLHQCDQFSQSFSPLDSLKQHMFAHGVEKPHKCEQSMQSYKRPHELSKHIESGNCKKRPYVCYICNSVFLQPQMFKIHITKQHRNSANTFANTELHTTKETNPAQKPDYPDKPLTEILQLTNMSRMARQGAFIRSLARRSSKTVDEGQVLERVRSLEPGQVQALLERRGARVAINMDWVVRLCMLERREAGLEEGRDICCSCGKVFKEIISLQTHQQ